MTRKTTLNATFVLVTQGMRPPVGEVYVGLNHQKVGRVFCCK